MTFYIITNAFCLQKLVVSQLKTNEKTNLTDYLYILPNTLIYLIYIVLIVFIIIYICLFVHARMHLNNKEIQEILEMMLNTIPKHIFHKS